MGHRALIAYERDDGQYNVHYSHWGGDSRLRLREKITEATPFGGDEEEPAFVNAMMAALSEDFGGEISGRLAEASPDTAVDPEPTDVGVGIEEIVNEILDFLHHEAFYVVDRDFDVRAFRTWRLHPPEDGEPFEKDVGNGVLVEWADFDEDGEPRHIGGAEGRHRGARDAAQAMYESGNLSRSDANDWLVRYIQTVVDERNTYMEIPAFSPYGYPAQNQRRGGYALSEIPLRKEIDMPDSV